jgi:diadenosine tetraphosphatase ApaH/serine/threonine PP2A family protein phosphatase
MAVIALLADIHANRQAFEACLADARAHGADEFVLLGDIVGYGADPSWCVETAMELAGAGAVAVKGNHDSAVARLRENLHAEAQIAIEWTRGELSTAQRAFLAELPMSVTRGDHLYVHADASAPHSWRYVRCGDDAIRSLKAAKERVTFCGHIHKPAVYGISVTAKLTSYKPVTGQPVTLLVQRRWLIVLGSAGQPRDGNPAASYALLNSDTNEITFMRVPYDVEAAAAAIRAKGLPQRLADRLLVGS